MPRIMFIAGEASGDMLGAELARALSEQTHALSERGASKDAAMEMFGAGGPKMAAAGINITLDLTQHAVVGIWEVLKNYPMFRSFFNQLIQLAEQKKPDVVVLIDYPGFNLRFARALRKLNIEGWKPKIVFYVSPQIWAWHESRLKQMEIDLDLVLSIFPFEKAWYEERTDRLRVEFVGHPLVDRFPRQPSRESISESSVALLPGSRVRELRKHLPVMLDAAALIQAPSTRLVLPNQALIDFALPWTSKHPSIKVQLGGLREALQTSTLAIAASGTVTLECAWFGVPTIVIYKTSWSTYALGRRFIKVPYLAMPNLLAKRELFPELIQDKANPTEIAAWALDILQQRSQREEIVEGLNAVCASLGASGASGRAAKLVLDLASR